jgi:Trypsin-like peptidase domain
VAKVVICPSCQSKGSIPDESKAARIRCPKCGEMFDVKGASGGASSAAMKKPGSSAGPRPAAAKPRSAAYSDLEDVEQLPPMASTSSRRSIAAAQPTRGQAAQQGSGQSPMIFVVAGIGGVAVLLLGILIVVVMRGNGQENAPAKGPVVADVPAAQPAAPVVTRTAAVAETPAPPARVLDSVEVARRLKDATVYLKNKIAGKTFASGSGFVIDAQGSKVIVATNRHVVAPDLSELPARLVPKGSVPEIEAVFRSAQGPNLEESHPAQIIAADSSGNISKDLAFLIVNDVKRPPKPLDVLTKSDATEGMTYTAAGFPFGGILSKVNESKGNPGVTITGGRISRLVKDDFGLLDLYQVDGSLQPGNSGGPVVEEKTGKFVGVVVAKMGAVDTIGFVVPAQELRGALAGRVGGLMMTLKDIQSSSASLEVKAQIVDPKAKVKDVLIHVAPASAGSISPNGDGSWPPLPNTTAVQLQRDPKFAMAAGNVQVALSGTGDAARKILIQTAHRDLQGKVVYSKPKEIELPKKPGPILDMGEVMKMLKALERASITMLGPLIDPGKDCKLVKDEDDLKIKITVPGGKIRSLAPLIRQRFNKKKPLHNAPMALIDVEGDFGAMVEVTGEMTPGAKLPRDREGNDLQFTFQGAGLLLYQDKDNFVRLERTAGVSLDDLHPIHKVLFEVVKDGKQVGNHRYPPVPEGTVYLVLARRKGRVQCGFSQDLTSPPRMLQQAEVGFDSKLKIGLCASNISAEPYVATFENFALINTDTQLKTFFGDGDIPEPKEAEKKKSR